MIENVSNETKTEIVDELPILFKLGLKALIKVKSDALTFLRELELELINLRQNLAESERIILLTTDFKELGLTNEKMRTAYVNEKLSDLTSTIELKKHEITSKKDDIEIINNLIEIKLQGE